MNKKLHRALIFSTVLFILIFCSYEAASSALAAFSTGDDSYSTIKDTPLHVPAPGVLANDSPGLLVSVNNSDDQSLNLGSVEIFSSGAFFRNAPLITN